MGSSNAPGLYMGPWQEYQVWKASTRRARPAAAAPAVTVAPSTTTRRQPGASAPARMFSESGAFPPMSGAPSRTSYSRALMHAGGDAAAPHALHTGSRDRGSSSRRVLDPRSVPTPAPRPALPTLRAAGSATVKSTRAGAPVSSSSSLSGGRDAKEGRIAGLRALYGMDAAPPVESSSSVAAPPPDAPHVVHASQATPTVHVPPYAAMYAPPPYGVPMQYYSYPPPAYPPYGYYPPPMYAYYAPPLYAPVQVVDSAPAAGSAAASPTSVTAPPTPPRVDALMRVFHKHGADAGSSSRSRPVTQDTRRSSQVDEEQVAQLLAWMESNAARPPTGASIAASPT